MSISMKTAELVIKGAIEKAAQIGVPVNVAVLDQAGHLKAFARMDDALLGSIEIAIKKARSAALFGLNTEALFEYCKPGGPSFGLENTNGGLIVFGGGIPLRNRSGNVIGAVGISGGSVQQDLTVAEAAVVASRTVTDENSTNGVKEKQL